MDFNGLPESFRRSISVHFGALLVACFGPRRAWGERGKAGIVPDVAITTLVGLPALPAGYWVLASLVSFLVLRADAPHSPERLFGKRCSALVARVSVAQGGTPGAPLPSPCAPSGPHVTARAVGRQPPFQGGVP